MKHVVRRPTGQSVAQDPDLWPQLVPQTLVEKVAEAVIAQAARGVILPGDRIVESPLGSHFVHVPTPAEVRADLVATGFRPEADVLRSHIANESAAVREFSDETRFWVAERP